MPSALSDQNVTASLTRAATKVLQGYFRNFPLRYGKLWVWDNVARPYVSWRDVTVEASTRTGLMMRGRLSDTIHNAVFFFGVWEPALTRYLTEKLLPGDVVVDIGANVGVHTMHAARQVGPAGRVHAIEASPSIFRILRENLDRNGIGNVIAHNVAVSDQPGTIAVFLDDTSNLGATTILAGRHASPGGRRETVKAMPIDEIVPRDDLLIARVIKIDVEGAEWLVLKGLEPLLPDLRQDVSIVVEVDASALAAHGASAGDLLRLFEAQGYEAARLPDHSAALCIDGRKADLLPVEKEFDMADLVFKRTLNQAGKMPEKP